MNDNPHVNDRELLALASEIDRLAFRDQGDTGLESRIYAATLPDLQSAARARANPPLRLVGAESAGTVVVQWRTSRFAMRIAAGLAVAATAGLAWLGTTRPSVPAMTGNQPMAALSVPAASGVDEWAIASAVFDDDFSDELSTLSNKASDLRETLDSIGTGDAYEEAM